MVGFSVKAVGRGLGSLLAVGGMAMIFYGGASSSQEMVSNGWILVIIAVALWSLSFIAREVS